MRKKVNKKLIVALLSFVLLFGGTFGSSLAWLFAESDDVQNTFTTSNINITLTETEGTDPTNPETGTNAPDIQKNYDMVPGCAIDKDPTITVLADSEDCWLFVKVEESTTLDDYIDYNLTADWVALDTTNYPNVYYYKEPVDSSTSNQTFAILGAGTSADDSDCTWTVNQVLTKPTVTKTMMDDLNKPNAVQPTLSFTAYASQYKKTADKWFTAAEAWANLNP